MRTADSIAEICEAVTRSRVGGSFWSVPASVGDRFSALIRTDCERAEPAIKREGIVALTPLLLSSVSADPPPVPAIGIETVALAGDHDPWTLIERSERIVASATDEVALLAAAAGRDVVDPETGEQFDTARLRDQLVADFDAWDYADPFTGAPIDVLEWIEILGEWRSQIDANRSLSNVVGIKGWKARALSRFLWADRPPRLLSASSGPEVGGGKPVGIWPSRVPSGFVRKAEDGALPLARIEDGFIRSIGLGTHLFPPCSIVIDMTGIYYDPNCPSDLERILSEIEFQPQLIERAAALVQLLVRGGVTKYAAHKTGSIELPDAARRVLVPGQVSDDLSVKLGGTGVTGNIDLLRRARAAEPDAWIGYRPHPDVSAGLRKGHVDDAQALQFADAVIRDGSIAELLDQVDCVHTLTSLAGFEALLRGCQVVTHGQPFYAGWGLTQDMGPPVERRRRRLTLLELVAGCLILYPRYVDPETGLPCSPELLVQRHLAGPKPAPTILNRLRSLQGKALVTSRRLVGAAA
ncbi:hypothetical protein PX554_06360 [Sphingomonas sp. H39-1-10]|uniref:capsular polysaccharide export protein, LipB/KpsS family n=1 Tax=Sphingomonas pollutisoli TaxID=3030829 RepID=UPI0023B8E2BF|nr:hypothetical protein [Sphingomonas pollutisoli]MDF0487746.1 hypothetical protein [Sphingomonas pollutisoli]